MKTSPKEEKTAEKLKKGLIQVYTGDGKGKTTAALGLALRASGRGLKVCFIQFCKGETSGEHLFIDRFQAFELLHPGKGNIFKSPIDQLKKEAQETLAMAEQKIAGGQYDLIVLDEINIAIYRGFLTLEQVLKVLDQKPPALELVLTGRYAAAELVKHADLVTEMLAAKHPFDKGFTARLGIEYWIPRAQTYFRVRRRIEPQTTEANTEVEPAIMKVVR